jgi:hypothetical protein
MWFGRLLLHRLEARVQVVCPRPLDLWHRALLRYAAGPSDAGGPFAALRLDEQVLGRLVRELAGAGLLGSIGGRWELTAGGRKALECGAVVERTEERRVFYFVDNAAAGRPPHFLPFQPPTLLAAAVVNSDWSFDVAALEACLHQPPEWKARHRFPADVEALVPPTPDAPSADNGPRVILDRAEQLLLVFVRVAAEGGAPHLLGFPVRAEGWQLGTEPVLELDESWPDVLPELAADPPPEAWRRAWQGWCQPRSVPPAEVEACRLERSDYRLLVHAPHRLIERLRAARSDAIKNQAWLLAGGDRTRTAAQVELRSL